MRSRQSFHQLIRLFAGIVAGALLVAACAPAAQPSPAAPAAKPAAEQPAQEKPAAEKPASAKSAAEKASGGLQQLIESAKKEGQVNIVGPSNLGEQAAHQIVDAMNAKYGTNIKLTWTSAGNFNQVVPQILTEYGTGGKPTWDAVMFNDTYMMTLTNAGHVTQYDYKGLFGIPDDGVKFGGNVVGFAHQLVLPVYNTNLVSEADAPKSWDDLLDPKWKGKIGVHTAVHHFVRLSQLWGDEKTTEFAERLAAQNPRLARINETYSSLVLGETLVSFTQTNSQVDKGLDKGEPVAWAMKVRPAIAPTYMCAGLKGTENPNAAALFCGFMFEKAAGEIWGEAIGRQNAFDPTTPLGEIYAEGKDNVLILKDDFPVEELEKREKKYSELLGFR